jgi:beta-lactam-binding protein with PASTA domain
MTMPPVRIQSTRTVPTAPLTRSSVSPFLIRMPSDWSSWWSYSPQAKIADQLPASREITSQPVTVSTAQSTQTQSSVTHSVPVPNVLRLRSEDAISAINKIGLSVGTITRVQYSQGRTGVVIQQAPRPRNIVPFGTQVSLWVIN